MTARLFWFRLYLVVCVPIVIPAVVLCDLAKEIKQSLRYAWLSARIEWGDVKRYWRDGPPRRNPRVCENRE